MTDKLRIGVVGCGGMASTHMQALAELDRVAFVAASDISKDNLQKTVDAYDIKPFEDAQKMIDSGLIDALFVGTPHYFHPIYVKAGLKAGLHVMTDKPVAVTAKAAYEINQLSAQHPDQVYAAMFNLRGTKLWQTVKSLLDNSQLGALRRLHWTATNWPRSMSYFQSSPWRATWQGEGGGILLNQAPHNLDMIYWLTGLPQSLTAKVALGKDHDIEVEDQVTAQFTYENGATGVFITSTSEWPPTDRLTLHCDFGRITVDTIESPDTVIVDRIKQSASDFCRNTKSNVPPDVVHEKIQCEPCRGWFEIWDNFVQAILDAKPLISPGTQGINSLELSNGMLLAGLKNKQVQLPTDHDEYEQLLQELIQNNKVNA